MARRPHDPIRLPARFWRSAQCLQVLANRDVPQLIRLVQHETKASQTQIGIAIGMSQPQVSEVLSGTRRVGNIDVLNRIAEGVGMPGHAIATFLLGRILDVGDHERSEALETPSPEPPVASAGHPLSQEPPDGHLIELADGQHTASRRDALRCVCGTLAAPGLHAVCPQCGLGLRLIQALNIVTPSDTHGPAVVADVLDDLVSHYSSTLYTLPPAEAYVDLLSARSYAAMLLDRAPMSANRRSDLIVTSGWLSNLLAIATSHIGDHAASLVWCSDAERRSQEARRPDLAAWAALTRAVVAFYQGSPRRAAEVASRGQGLVPIGTVAHTRLAAQEMRSRAMLGDISGTTQARRRAATSLTSLRPDAPTAGVFSIAPAEDPPYTATSLLLLGRFQEAVSTTNRVIETTYRTRDVQPGEQPSHYARSLLVLGLAHAGLGQADEAAAAGQAALEGAQIVWPTMVLAGRLNRVLMREFADATPTAQFQSKLLQASARTSTNKEHE